MIIDYAQRQDSFEISYVNPTGQIEIQSILLPNGYYNYTRCDEFDPDRIPDLKSFKGFPIKKEAAKFFTHHNINEFLKVELQREYPEIFDKMNKMNLPMPFSVDIETDITDEYGYSNTEETQNMIRSISITDINLNSILFIVRNPDHPEITPSDNNVIDSVLREALGEYYHKYEYKREIRIFDTEQEMLDVFFQCINRYFHSLIGWNVIQYDNEYWKNRAKKIGVEFKKASPKNILFDTKVKLSAQDKFEYQYPKHRIITDYMILFKRSQKFSNLEAYSLNAVSETILGLKKVSYQGNLRKLYKDNYPRFVAYAFVDTILVMLLHKATNLYNTNFFHSYYTGVPYCRISQSSLSEALIYNELRADGIFILESEKNQCEKRKYIGGYVKNPTKKFVESVMGEDFASLYPSVMLTIGLTPEKKIDSIEVNEDGYPANVVDQQKWEKYKQQGCCLSPMGRIYDNREDGLYIRIQKKLFVERKKYKGFQNDIYLNVIPAIEEELKKRNIKF